MSNYSKFKNLVYAQTEAELLVCDFYLPERAENVPVIIMVHGGAFQAGSKEMYAAWGQFFAKNGIAAMAIDYRLATPEHASYPGIVQDMRSAINFVIAKAADWNLDLLNIGFLGDSAGAYLGTMAAFSNEFASAKIKYVVAVYGVFDLVEWAHYTNATRIDHVVTKMFGQDIHTGLERYKQASPMFLIDRVAQNPVFDTKFLMIYGDKDEIVLPKNQTLKFVEKLQEYKIPYELVLAPGKGHFWFTKNDMSNDYAFDKFLENEISEKVLSYIKRNNNSKY